MANSEKKIDFGYKADFNAEFGIVGLLSVKTENSWGKSNAESIKEMNKFFVVENAFKTIKIATGVSDAETLVKKFLNKEADYGDLLGRIAQNEKRIEFLKNETEDLLHEQKVLVGEQ